MENEIAKILVSSPANTARAISRGKYKIPRHIAFLDNIIVETSYRKRKRLIVSLPPRHGKSELISKYFPFWYLGTFPTHRVILTSYEANFAAAWGRKVRDLFDEFGEQTFGVSLKSGSASIQNFELSRGGAMMTAGIGGPITGKGADLLIIDDPVKNDAEAQSPTYRNNTWEWFLSTAFTRIEPNGIVIIVMTRWNEDDLAGRLLENFSKDWDIIKIPAIAQENDPLGRSIGEALWEERFSLEKLNEIKTQIGSYWFSALYQQSPTAQDGNIFKRSDFKYFKLTSELYDLASEKIYAKDCPTFACVDLAISTDEKADYTVAVIFALSPDRNILILEVIREKIDPVRHLPFLKNLFNRFNIKLFGIESVQYQKTLVKQALAEGIPTKELRADKDKYSRALPIAALLEAGKVYFKQNAEWLGDFESELLAFPNGKNDDQVDALAYITMLCPASSSNFLAGRKLKTGMFTDF